MENIIVIKLFFIWHLVDALLPHTLFLQWVERWLLRQSCLTPRLLIFLQVIMPRPRGRGRGRGRPVLTNDVRQPEVVFWNICIANTRVHTLPHYVILCLNVVKEFYELLVYIDFWLYIQVPVLFLLCMKLRNRATSHDMPHDYYNVFST